MANSPNPAAAQNLLNLLNFTSKQNADSRQNGRLNGQPDNSKDSTARVGQQRSISASDLVARLMSPPNEVHPNTDFLSERESLSNSPRVETMTQNPLLELLNRQSSTKPKVEKEGERDQENTYTGGKESSQRTSSPMRIFGSAASRENTPFEVSTPTATGVTSPPIFTYSNPFEALKASRPHSPPSSKPPAPASKDKDGNPSVTRTIPQAANATPSKSQDAQEHENTKASEPSSEPPHQANGELKSSSERGIGHEPDPDTTVKSTLASSSGLLGSTEGSKPDNPSVADAITSRNDPQDPSGEWEDIQETSGKEETTRIVPVLNFPIKAFVSITMQMKSAPVMDIRDDGVLEISRIKKDFDQIDRSLAAATSKYITYSFVKHGGFRIIRQDDGKDRHVFKNSQDRIFNVSTCTAATNGSPTDEQAVLGTGVSGDVYYATISKDRNDLFEKNELNAESLIFPAVPSSDEHTAGGLLKTRARRSSRHPEFFAIGRGRLITLIQPKIALSPHYGIDDSNRRVDMEKLFQEHGLHISTGKAGKDFVFSEDDTTIVSLDKTGRLRFWDIRRLTDEMDTTSQRVKPITVERPLLSLMTASPAERSWPTSVLFVDKARPYAKGGPLRYVLVGLRQNHTLQLWDIALGKAVQELHFPHENEVDGICSVNYHPASGIIVVGHPTRNSLFFIHLSAPRYTLSSSLSQAAYIQRVAAKDPDLPKPESTACMSGVRELSFGNRGQLRSVELLNVQKAGDKSKPTQDGQVLFELYIVHSKGVTCVGINKDDLGWDNANKVIKSVDSEKEGFITINELKLGSVIEEPVREISPAKETSQQGSASKNSIKKKSKKTKDANEDEADYVGESQASLPPPVYTSATTESNPKETNSADLLPAKESKKSKRKAAQAAMQNLDQPTTTSFQNEHPASINEGVDSATAMSSTLVSTGSHDPMHQGKTDALSMSISGDWLDKELKKIERGVSTELKKEFDLLYQNIHKDRTLQDQSSASRQEAILRLVSSSLNDNVEKSLSQILATQMHEVAVPAISQSVTTELTDTIIKNLTKTIPQNIEKTLPNALRSVVDASHISKGLTDTLSQKLGMVCQHQITTMFNESLVPGLRESMSTAINSAVIATENRLAVQINQLQAQNAENKEKMDKMSSVIESLGNTLRTMSETQVSFQHQILKERRANASSGAAESALATRQTSSARVSSSPAPKAKVVPAKVKSKAEIELDEVAALMEQGKYEEGSIKWLQSSQPVKLFDELFVKFTPDYLASDVSPLVAFSIAVTVANTLLTNTERRLEWISAAFDAVNFQDQEIVELSKHAPQLIGSMIHKLESLYMSLAERGSSESLLQLIPPIAKKARDLRATFQAVYDESKA